MFTRLSPLSYRSAMDIRFLVLDLARLPAGHELKAQSEPAFVTDDRHPVRQDQRHRAQAGHHGTEGEEGAAAGGDGDSRRAHGGRETSGTVGSSCPTLRAGLRGHLAPVPVLPQGDVSRSGQDVKAAVRWVKTHAKEHNIDPERLGAVGFSAGGHLALMLGLTGPADGLEGERSAGGPDSRVKAVVNFFGPTDLAASDIPDASKPLVRGLPGRPRRRRSPSSRPRPRRSPTSPRMTRRS